jgi:hypothetical protein
MTTADWAFVISLCSVAISLAAFVWNIWSKFIFPKAQVHVSFSFVQTIDDQSPEEALALCATPFPNASLFYFVV